MHKATAQRNIPGGWTIRSTYTTDLTRLKQRAQSLEAVYSPSGLDEHYDWFPPFISLTEVAGQVGDHPPPSRGVPREQPIWRMVRITSCSRNMTNDQNIKPRPQKPGTRRQAPNHPDYKPQKPYHTTRSDKTPPLHGGRNISTSHGQRQYPRSKASLMQLLFWDMVAACL